MPAPRIRANYDELAKVAQQLNGASQNQQQVVQSLKQQVDVLRGGDWEGKGSKAFYDEMDHALFPALNRLAQALGLAAQTTSKITAIMRRAEHDAGVELKKPHDENRSDGVNSDGGAGGGGAGSGEGAGGDGGGTGAAAGGSGSASGSGSGGAASGSASGSAGGFGGASGSATVSGSSDDSTK